MPKTTFMKASLLVFFLSCATITVVYSQIPTQTIKGTIVDQDSQAPLIGATIQITDGTAHYAEISDIDGEFRLAEVPVGRHTAIISYLGYDPAVLNVNVESGKELVLSIALQEAINLVEEIVVTASAEKNQTLNEMATVSGRSFSVEETGRYAASFLDPGRMAQNYAGVVSAGDDVSNEIVIRGNSPTYVQWRLEGIPIPAPNHFADKGSSGGGISMLSSSMLADSDFYTGAFPAEIGNVLAGAFDLNFRNGNNENRESSFMAGVIGIEASTEGPFSKKSKASYLINYRYSALEILGEIANLDFGDFSPNFQDLSFKVNVPTNKAGVFSLFGILGNAKAKGEIEMDSTQWNNFNDLYNFNEENNYGLIGLSHKYLFENQKTYLKTVIAGSLENYEYFDEVLDRDKNEMITDEIENLKDNALRMNVVLNHKASAKHAYRIGTTLSRLGYAFDYKNRRFDYMSNFRITYGPLETLINTKGNTAMTQAFAQHKYRPHKLWTINYGIHFIHLGLTNSSAIEPRGGVKWAYSPKSSIALSAGLHSQAEHLINYTLERKDSNGNIVQPNLGLSLTRAAHFVLAHDWNVKDNLRIKVEAYHQRLFDVPVDTSFIGGSILNADDVYDILFNSNRLQTGGTGQNTGIDVTVEKFLDKGLYWMITGSLFESTFVGQDNKTYNTRFNSGYNLTMLAGKEYNLGSNDQNKIAINGKAIFNGGNRYTEYDFDTRAPTSDGIYKLQADPYYRIDLGFTFTKNRTSSTHKITFEVQNLMNRLNTFRTFPDFDRGSYRTNTQAGIIPNINYRIEF